jgi:hypothetical protein
MNKGRQTQTHKMKEISSASITAADPKSLARFDRSWCSNEMRSIAASTLELSNSTAITSTRELINTAFSKSDTEFQKNQLGQSFWVVSVMTSISG